MTALVWDMDVVPTYVDATCDFQGIEIDTGNPDEHFNFEAGHAVVQLDNRNGTWSRYNADGTQAHGPGYPLALWAIERDTGLQSWMFNGMITRWNEFAADGTVEIEAFDAEATLAQPIGSFTPGSNGQTAGPRLAAVMAAAGRSAIPVHFDTGTATLTAQATDAAPLEEMQAVASSDGGLLFADADGSVRYLSRNWRVQGRSDQPSVPVASDNVCTVGVLDVWNATLSTNDDGVADTVILTNVAKLTAQAPAGAITGTVFTETDHQWTTQIEGDTVAAIIYATQQDPRVNIEEFEVYVYDPHQPGAAHAVEWRLIDSLRFLHDAPVVDGSFVRLDLNTMIKTISHDITPDQWIMTVATTKALAANAILVWNPPSDPYVWDAADAVWGF